MAGYVPVPSYYIVDLSDRTVREVCDLLLNYPSVIGARCPGHARAAQVLFPDEPFVHPGGYMSWLYPWAWSILDKIGLWIQSGQLNDGRWGLLDSDYFFVPQYQPALKAAAMESLFPAAYKVITLLCGPEPFRPSGARLRDLYPYFLPSASYSRYVRDITGKDIEPGLAMIEKYVSLSTQTVVETFPRIRKFLE
jgi:hypothetical protein